MSSREFKKQEKYYAELDEDRANSIPYKDRIDDDDLFEEIINMQTDKIFGKWKKIRHHKTSIINIEYRLHEIKDFGMASVYSVGKKSKPQWRLSLMFYEMTHIVIKLTFKTKKDAQLRAEYLIREFLIKKIKILNKFGIDINISSRFW